MLLTIKETARRLGIAEQTIYNGISRKSDRKFPINPKRWGRKVLFDSRDVEAFIRNLPYEDVNTLGTYSSELSKKP
jgi:predicted DNA-binding transcriptional regulator AlpA